MRTTIAELKFSNPKSPHASTQCQLTWGQFLVLEPVPGVRGGMRRPTALRGASPGPPRGLQRPGWAAAATPKARRGGTNVAHRSQLHCRQRSHLFALCRPASLVRFWRPVSPGLGRHTPAAQPHVEAHGGATRARPTFHYLLWRVRDSPCLLALVLLGNIPSARGSP